MFKSSVRYFAAVVQHGSIRAAAEALRIAQSAVSRQLQALEHELGAPLLERRPRGVVLTEAGEILHHYLCEVGFHVDRVRSEIDALKGLRRGHVTLYTVESLIGEFVPRAIAQFRKRYPGITLEVVSAGSDRVIQAVRAGEADLGVALHQEVPREVHVAFRHHEPIYAVMVPSHPLARSDRLTIAEVAGWPLALSLRWTGTRQLAERASAQAGVVLEPVLESNSLELLHQFAVTGQGITLLTRTLCRHSLEAGTLVAVPLIGGGFDVAALDVLQMAGRRLPLAAEAFLATLCSAFRADDPEDALPKRHRHDAGIALSRIADGCSNPAKRGPATSRSAI